VREDGVQFSWANSDKQCALASRYRGKGDLCRETLGTEREDYRNLN